VGVSSVVVVALAGIAVTACATPPIAAPQVAERAPAAADGEWVFVGGDVTRPGRVPFVRGRTSFTVTKLLALSGWVGEPQTAVITRSGSDAQTVVLDSVIAGRLADPELRPGDFVRIVARR
jgi:protein involved in polysaccharide export with SLBB domain